MIKIRETKKLYKFQELPENKQDIIKEKYDLSNLNNFSLKDNEIYKIIIESYGFNFENIVKYLEYDLDRKNIMLNYQCKIWNYAEINKYDLLEKLIIELDKMKNVYIDISLVKDLLLNYDLIYDLEVDLISSIYENSLNQNNVNVCIGDATILKHNINFDNYSNSTALLNICFNNVIVNMLNELLENLIIEYDYINSLEYITEICNNNNYLFDLDCNLVNIDNNPNIEIIEEEVNNN